MNPPKKKPAKPEPDEPLEPDNGEPDEDQPEPDDENGGPEPLTGEAELKIVIKRHVIEVDVPRDGNETDTFQRLAQLVDEL